MISELAPQESTTQPPTPLPASSPDGGNCARCACYTQCLLGMKLQATGLHIHVSEHRFRKGEMLQQQGRVSPTIRVVKVGTLVQERRSDDGVDRPVGLVSCNQLLGAAAFLEEPASLSYTAVTPGRVCEIPLRPLREHLRANTEFLNALAHEQLQLGTRLADWGQVMRVRGVVGQVANALLLLADQQRSTLIRLPSQSLLAELLSTTRESIARALSQLTQLEAIIRPDRWHCELQRDKLASITAGTK